MEVSLTSELDIPGFIEFDGGSSGIIQLPAGSIFRVLNTGVGATNSKFGEGSRSGMLLLLSDEEIRVVVGSGGASIARGVTSLRFRFFFCFGTIVQDLFLSLGDKQLELLHSDAGMVSDFEPSCSF